MAPSLKATFSLILLAACTGSTAPTPTVASRVDLAWVTEDVARSIADGLFVNPSATTEFTGELPLARIEPIATAFVHSIGTAVGNLREVLEGDHGAPIDFASLVACQRSYYLRSSFEPLDSTNRPLPEALLSFRPGFEGAWYIRFCDRDKLLVLSVMTFASTTIILDETGGLDRFEPSQSADFFTTAFSRTDSDPFRSPEDAVRLLFQIAGVRIATVPDAIKHLVAVGPIGFQGLYWRLQTESPIRGRHGVNGDEIVTDDFYVSFRREDAAVRVAPPDPHPPIDIALPDLGLTLHLVPRWALQLAPFIPSSMQ